VPALFACGPSSQGLAGRAIAQLFTVEDHAAQDVVHKGFQGGGVQPVLVGNGGQLAGVLARLEAFKAVADGLFVQPLARLQRVDELGDVVALVHEFGIGLDQADKLFTAHLLLAWRLLRVAGDEGHNVVVVDDGGGKQHELEIKLLHSSWCIAAAFFLLFFQALGCLQIDALEALQMLLGQYLLDGLGVFRREVGVLVELGLEALHFLEQVDELTACGVALEVGHLLRFVAQPLRLHEVGQLLHGGLQLADDHRCLVH